MKTRFVLLLTFVFVCADLLSAGTLTFTGDSSGVKYSVNNPSGFFVSNSPITGPVASAGTFHNNVPNYNGFRLSATDPQYSDAGIVLFFDGGLTLGELQSVDVVSNNPSAMNINLWLDTGGDGHFFAFDSNGLLTGLNGDDYGSHSGQVLTTADIPANNIDMFYGGGNHSLAYFQSGAASAFGINANTPTALWIGITNSGVAADINSITVNTVPEPASIFLLGGGLIGIVMALRRKRV